MGFGVTELLIILAIVLVLFGAKKLRNIGGDLGGAIKNFKTAMKDEESNKSSSESTDKPQESAQLDSTSGTTIEGSVESESESKTKEQV